MRIIEIQTKPGVRRGGGGRGGDAFVSGGGPSGLVEDALHPVEPAGVLPDVAGMHGKIREKDRAAAEQAFARMVGETGMPPCKPSWPP